MHTAVARCDTVALCAVLSPCLNTARALIGELYLCMHTVSVTELPVQYNVLGALTLCICTLVWYSETSL